MKVLKFGGSSVGSAKGLVEVKKIVESQNEATIVVVSALSGVTDKLYTISEMAAMGDSNYMLQLDEVYQRHFNLLTELNIQDISLTNELLEAHFKDLSNILRGIYLIKDISSRITDTIVSYGELLSSIIVSKLIGGAVHFDSREFIKTSFEYDKNMVDFPATNNLIKDKFLNIPQFSVCGGFISSDILTNKTTNLGRGGSDYTASIIASALNANKLEIWTDVDGFMTADPKIISKSYVINHLSFSEAMELSNFGARVIYPPTIFPVYHKNIPVEIKNTFNSTASGTLISSKFEGNVKSKQLIKGISSISDTTLIVVHGLGMVGVIGVNYRIFRALANNNISVFMVSQASSENNTSIAVKEDDSQLAIKVLNEEFKAEIQQGEMSKVVAIKDLVTIAIVGDGMKGTPGIAGKLFDTLGRNGINVVTFAQGVSETNISCVISKSEHRKALNVIHESFFLSDYKELNLFIVGVGTVGGSLLKQINEQRQKLMDQNKLRINVVGIASSKKMIFDRSGIDLENCIETLQNEGIKSSTKQIKDEIIEMNIYNSVFVDCTANEEVAEIYQNLLENNISVIAANKIAASSDFENYQKLKETARDRGVKFLFETNVGAGLPIINTMNNLTNSGDKILQMEAVVSGTLNFIFNTISEDIPLSRAIKMSQEMGFSEPDPRIDLSGIDVIRKLVILTREAGYQIEQDDVERELFVGEKYFNGSLDDFWKNITELDEEFEIKRKELVKQNQAWRFVASMDMGKCKVGLREISHDNPFYDLQGSNNIISIKSERYNEHPLIVKGYGAGASVTAAGVFADIISIANIR